MGEWCPMSFDHRLPRPEDPRSKARAAASVDGADGPTAYKVLAPLGVWPPLIDPATVKQVRFEVTGEELVPYRLHFDKYGVSRCLIS